MNFLRAVEHTCLCTVRIHESTICKPTISNRATIDQFVSEKFKVVLHKTRSYLGNILFIKIK